MCVYVSSRYGQAARIVFHIQYRHVRCQGCGCPCAVVKYLSERRLRTGSTKPSRWSVERSTHDSTSDEVLRHFSKLSATSSHLTKRTHASGSRGGALRGYVGNLS